MDLFLGVHVVSRDEGVTIPSVLQQPRSLRMTVVRRCTEAGFCSCHYCLHVCEGPLGVQHHGLQNALQ